MNLHFFFIPARAPESAQLELNRFIAAHRVLALRREWLADGADSGWAICVETVAGPGPLAAELKAPGSRRGADVDYKAVLSPADFAVYSRLREVRKQLAQDAGVPVYGVFSNEQMAAMVTQQVRSLVALRAIEGIGAGRVDKFGAAMLAVLQQAEAMPDADPPLGQVRRLTIHDPKRREITAACFEDRVLHHAILNLAEPRFERALLDSVYACRPGKGVHAAVLAVQRGLQRWPWVVQVDVAGYFTSIRHDRVLDQVARLFKGDDFLALLARIVAAGSQEHGRGLPIGSLTSQHLANHHLGGADRLLMAHAGVRAHVRYMDDLLWCCDSLDAAWDSLAALREQIEDRLDLRLKPGAQPRPCRQGVRFCGFRVRPGVVLAGGRKLRRARRQAQRLRIAEAAAVPQADLQRAAAGQVAALLPAQTLRFRQRLWWPDGDPGVL